VFEEYFQLSSRKKACNRPLSFPPVRAEQRDSYALLNARKSLAKGRERLLCPFPRPPLSLLLFPSSPLRMPAPTSDYLFSDSLIPSSVREVPSGLTLRPLASSDYSRGHLSLLSHLTSAPDVGNSVWSTRFEEIKAINAVQPTYFTVVVVEDESDRVVGQATVFVERKFLRNAGLVGHIEDVVVDPQMQGKKLGLKLLQVLTALSESVGAYKVCLASFLLSELY
jgi:glucosamine-phosphate N-acetyltransferase